VTRYRADPSGWTHIAPIRDRSETGAEYAPALYEHKAADLFRTVPPMSASAIHHYELRSAQDMLLTLKPANPAINGGWLRL